MNQIISIDPSTLAEIGRVDETSEQKVKEYVSKARAAAPMWSRLSFKERAGYILKAREYLIKNIDDFAETITRDNGKPLTESLSAEIYPICDLLYWAAKNAEKILAPKKVGVGVFELMFRSSYIDYQPLGVIGVISPWNYPFSIPVGTVAMALMAGNCVVLKSSSATPLVGQKIDEMFRMAGLPDCVFTHITGGAVAGEALLDTSLNKVIFTGSVETGKHVAEICAKKLLPVTLELGGKDPCIVRKDCDLDHASSGAVWGAFTNAGQCCASIERVYVHESIAEKFTSLVVEKTKKLRMGIDVGPMTTLSQLQIVTKQVEEAVQKGAKILTGGKTPSCHSREETVSQCRGGALSPPNNAIECILWPAQRPATTLRHSLEDRNPVHDKQQGYFFPPTVITNVDQTFSCVSDETFGPLLPIMTYDDDQQAIQLANDSQCGLNAYIWTKDIKAGEKMASQLRAGTVVINDCVYTHAIPQTPWGGVKHSGFGRTHGEWGFYELTNLHHVHINRLTLIKNFWWYPYSDKLANGIKNLSKTLTGDIKSQICAIPYLLKCLLRKRL